MAGFAFSNPTQYATAGGQATPITPEIAQQLALASQLQQGGSSSAPIYGGYAEGLARLAQGLLGGYLSGQAGKDAQANQASIAETLAKAATAGKGWTSPDTFQGANGQTIQAGTVAPGTGGRSAMAATLAGNPLTAGMGADLWIEAQKSAEDVANQRGRDTFQLQGQKDLESQREAASLALAKQQEGSQFALARLQQQAPTPLSRDLQAAGLKPGTPEYTDAVSSYYGKALPTLPIGKMWGTDANGKRVAVDITDQNGQPIMGSGDNSIASWGLKPMEEKALMDKHETLQKQAEGLRSLYSLRALNDQTPSGVLGPAEATAESWFSPQGTDAAARGQNASMWDKIANDVVTGGLRDAFGGKITNLELSNQLSKFPSVSMRHDARGQMLDELIGKAQRAYGENFQEANALSKGRYAQLYKPGDFTGNSTALNPAPSPAVTTGNTGGPGVPGSPGAAPTWVYDLAKGTWVQQGGAGAGSGIGPSAPQGSSGAW